MKCRLARKVVKQARNRTVAFLNWKKSTLERASKISGLKWNQKT